MTLEKLALSVAEMKRGATRAVRRYAAVRAGDVPEREVDAICRALGEISVEEAYAALDRLQRQQAQPRR